MNTPDMGTPTPRTAGAVKNWPLSLWPSIQEYPQLTARLGPTEQMELAEVVDKLERELTALHAAHEAVQAALKEMLISHENLYRSRFGERSNPNDDIVRQQALRTISRPYKLIGCVQHDCEACITRENQYKERCEELTALRAAHEAAQAALDKANQSANRWYTQAMTQSSAAEQRAADLQTRLDRIEAETIEKCAKVCYQNATNYRLMKKVAEGMASASCYEAIRALTSSPVAGEQTKSAAGQQTQLPSESENLSDVDVKVAPVAAHQADKAAAFEWLRALALGTTPDARPAALLLQEISELNGKVKAAGIILHAYGKNADKESAAAPNYDRAI